MLRSISFSSEDDEFWWPAFGWFGDPWKFSRYTSIKMS